MDQTLTTLTSCHIGFQLKKLKNIQEQRFSADDYEHVLILWCEILTIYNFFHLESKISQFLY